MPLAPPRLLQLLQQELGGKTLNQMGEENVVAGILAHTGQASDDCAIIPCAHASTVITTDSMVCGHDFKLEWHHPYSLGVKLAASNLADVAAMGAKPVALTLAACVPGELPFAFIAKLLAGITEYTQKECGTKLLSGGDTAHSANPVFTVTAVGVIQTGKRAVTRSGARPGDTLGHAGELGLSQAGLDWLCREDKKGYLRSGLHEVATENDWLALTGRPERPAPLNEKQTLCARDWHLAPRPPLQLGPAALEAGATAMLDVSDGLSLDATRLARASNVTLNIFAEKLKQKTSSPLPLEKLLHGGEDHGLLAAFPATSALPEGFTRIGEVLHKQENPLLLDGKKYVGKGWDALRRTL